MPVFWEANEHPWFSQPINIVIDLVQDLFCMLYELAAYLWLGVLAVVLRIVETMDSAIEAVVDLEATAAYVSYAYEWFSAINVFFPVDSLLKALVAYLTFCLVFSVVKIGVKLIPTIG